MGDPGLARVGFGPAQLFACYFLVRHRFDHIGAGHEHVAGALGHENEIRQGRRIHRSARTRTEDGTQLWNHPTGAHVAVKNIRIATERHHAFLDARPTAIVQANERSAVLHRQVHDAANFLGVGFRQGSSQHREVLRKHIHQPAIDPAIACDNTVTEKLLFVQPEVGRTVLHEHPQFLETIGIQKQVQAFTRRQFAFGMLGLNALFTTSLQRLLAQFIEPISVLFHEANLRRWRPRNDRASCRTFGRLKKIIQEPCIERILAANCAPNTQAKPSP